MTLQELSRYFELKRRLLRNEEMLESLRDAAQPGSQNLDGMPHAPSVYDKVGNLAVEIADLETRIQRLREEAAAEEERVAAYIREIDNDQTRMIFRLRFIHCLTWGEVAAVIGGHNSESSVKNICYRYLGEKTCDAPGGVVLAGAASDMVL